MKQDNINYLLVGCFVLAATVLLLAALFRITGVSGDTADYYVEYSNISGIQEGSKVTFGGYKVGVVAAISPLRKDRETRFRLRLAIASQWSIPKDSTARIVMPAVLAAKQIDILPGGAADTLLPGDSITGQEGDDLVAMMNTMAAEIRDLSRNNLKPFIASLDAQVNGIGLDLRENIPPIAAKLNVLLEQLQESAGKFANLVGDRNQQHINNVFRNADEVAANLARLTRDFADARMLIDQLLRDSHKVIAENDNDVRQSVLELRKTLETVSQHIGLIVYNLEGSSRNMNEFSREIRENPGLLLSGGKREKQDEAGE